MTDRDKYPCKKNLKQLEEAFLAMINDSAQKPRSGLGFLDFSYDYSVIDENIKAVKGVNDGSSRATGRTVK